MNLFLFLLLLVMGIGVQAQTITTDNFGSGSDIFSIDFVEIGNPGNAADTSGNPNPAGAVAYTYHLGKYEISREVIAKANAGGGLGITLADLSTYGGNAVERPATGISWNEAAKFVNWLNTSTGRSAAYKFDANGQVQFWTAGEAGFDAANPTRNALAKYVLPTAHEWYKGAYGSPSGAWYNYSLGSDSVPTSVANGSTGVVYNRGTLTGPAAVTDAGGLSPFGTMAQGGNAREWTESIFNATGSTTMNREERGGSWYNFSSSITVTGRNSFDPGREGFDGGFRVAFVPEPASSSLLLVAGVTILMVGRKRRASRGEFRLRPSSRRILELRKENQSVTAGWLGKASTDCIGSF